MNLQNQWKMKIWQTLLLVMLFSFSVHAQQAAEPAYAYGSKFLTVPLYKSRLIALDAPATRVSVGNPDVADILILRASQLYVLGKDLGTTNVLLWDRNDILIDTIEVEVTHDLQSLKQKLHELLPNERIEVRSAQRNIVLSGSVSNVTNMEAALRIARGYFAAFSAVDTTEFAQEDDQGGDDSMRGEIINLMNIGGVQQVMLEVKVAEISRTELRRLDVRFNAIVQNSSRWVWGGVNGGAGFPDAVFPPGDVRVPVFGNAAPLGPVIDEFAPNDLVIEDKGFFASLLTDSAMFNVAFDAAKEKGLAKILAEPTLTTQTGQEAEFLSGGEFPIPVPQGATEGVTIEFKEFGVGVKFLPVVLDNNRINLKLNISVSELVSGNTIGINLDGVTSSFLIPALTKRSAISTVELADGQTIGIAGLINENLREVVTKFPMLGSIPGIGALFRSQEFIKGETELLILVTPHLAKPLGPEEIRLPTDGFAEPSDFDWYVLGRTEGKSEPSTSP
jgi:pilus assembly protein CpaC